MRSGYGTVFEISSGGTYEHFRRRTEDVHGNGISPAVFLVCVLPPSAEAQEIHIGRRIHGAQRAVEIERSDSRLEVPTLGKDDLKNVAGGDELLGTADAFEEFRLGS